MAGRTSARVVTYGFSDAADVRGVARRRSGRPGCASSCGRAPAPARSRIPGLGRHAVHNALAAAAVGLVAEVGLDAIAVGLATASEAAHRGELIRLGDVTIVDDSYNAAPATMLAALDVLAGLPGRRVAVLGEMLELGAESEAGHRSVGRAAGRVADLLVVVGDEEGWLAEGALEAGLEPSRILPGGRCRGGPRRAGPAARTRRRGARQGIARDRARPPRRDAARGARPVSIGTVELIQGLLLAFFIVVILMPPFIRLLRYLRFGKNIREEGPASHQVKQGGRPAAGSCSS